MSHRRTALALALLGLLGSGCRPDFVTPPPQLLNGTWVRPHEVPGSSETWTLSVNGTAIAGTGTWSGEACCGGTIGIVGTVVAGAVHLDLSYTTSNGAGSPTFSARFDGGLATPDVLLGSYSRDNGPPALAEMDRR